MYQALYRKYRPQTFDDVIGQNHITESLKNQIINDRLSHAYIFIGTRGTGKTTCARILAKAVNCEHPVNGNPCCNCASCKGIADGTIMDIVELDAASNNGIDNVRALRDEAIFTPSAVKKRVYIIDEVHMLSTAAFNALLKILEEPPKHLLFVLATTELQKVPATILSRCQRHAFKRVENSELSNYLINIAKKENLDISKEAASLISSLGEGSVRDAISMLDQCSTYSNIGIDEVYSAVGLAGNSRIISLFERLSNNQTELLLAEFNELWNDGKDPAGIIKELSSFARDVLITKVAPNGASSIVYGGYDGESINKFAEKLSVNEITNYVEILQETLVKMKDRIDPKICAEISLIRLTSEFEQTTSVNSSKISTANINKLAIDNSKVNEVKKINNDSQTVIETERLATQKVDIIAPQNVKIDNIIISDELKEIWPNLCKSLKYKMVLYIDDQSIVQPELNNNVLQLHIAGEFYFGYFNKVKIIETIEDSLRELTNKQYTVKIIKDDKFVSNVKDLKELSTFPEVKYVDN